MEHSYKVPGGISKGEESERIFDKCGKEMQTKKTIAILHEVQLTPYFFMEKV